MQNLIYNRNTQVIVSVFPNGDERWLCPNCLNYMIDEYCKEGYTATCSKCKKEFKIIKVRKI